MPYIDRSYRRSKRFVPKAGYRKKSYSQLKTMRKPKPTRAVPYPDIGIPQNALIARVPWGVPKERWMRFRYCDEITIDPGAASIAAHYYRANSLFDPDLTGTGHQPMNFDQMILGYLHYTVYGAKIKITRVRSVTTQILPAYFGVFLDSNATLSYTTAPQIMESNEKHSKWLMTGGLEGGAFGMPSIELGCSVKKFMGVKDLSSPAYRTAFNANPTEDVNFCIWGASIADNNPGGIIVVVEIEYLCKLSERSFVAQS